MLRYSLRTAEVAMVLSNSWKKIIVKQWVCTKLEGDKLVPGKRSPHKVAWP